MRRCAVPDCKKPMRSQTGNIIYCPMHMARLSRNDSLEVKSSSQSHGLEKLPRDIVDDIIRKNVDNTDQDVAIILQHIGYPDALAHHIKYRRKKLGITKNKLGGWHYQKKLALKTYGNHCEICTYNLTVDVHHIIEKRKGGSHELENLCVICPNCHALIHRAIFQHSFVSRDDIPILITEYSTFSHNTFYT